jgi:cobalamin biosynthesis Mg chelatase CobN
MPSNLNALLRYKTIDECLSNSFLECTIEVLISKCNEVLSEQQSNETNVSERTIRNDIRILRSDALGFNAPIIVQNGVYSYEVSGFSIFSRPVKEMELLIDIQTLLVEEFDNIQNPNLSHLIIALAELTKEKVPRKCAPPEYGIFEKRISNRNVETTYSEALNDYIYREYHRKKFPKKKFVFLTIQQKPLLPEWHFIFDAICRNVPKKEV